MSRRKKPASDNTKPGSPRYIVMAAASGPVHLTESEKQRFHLRMPDD